MSAGLDELAPIDPRAVAAARANPLAWAKLVTGGEFQVARHTRFVTQQLLRVARGECRRLCVSLPPGHTKSWLVNRFLPGWWLGNRQKDRIITLSATEEFSKTWAKAVRDDLAVWGGHVFGSKVWGKAAARRWSMLHPETGRPTGGGLFACGIDGTIMGNRANLVVIDDLYADLKEADKQELRDHHHAVYQEAVTTRLLPGGSVIIIMTRAHEDDLIGRVLAEAERRPGGHPWTVINLPAIAEAGDPLGRAPGEALWPEYYPLEELLPKQAESSERSWTTLFQGRPAPQKGALFKRALFRYSDLTRDLVTVQAKDGPRSTLRSELILFGVGDLAVTEKRTSDASGLGVFAADLARAELHFLGVERGKWDGPTIIAGMQRQVDPAGAWRVVAIFVERTAYNLQLCQLALTHFGLPIRYVEADASKTARAQVAVALLEHGRLYFSRQMEALSAVEADLLRFPVGGKDEVPDLVAYAARVFLDMLQAKRAADAEAAKHQGPSQQSIRVR